MYNEMPMHEGRDLPFFSLREIDLPQVRTWEVGGQYYLVIGVEMTGKREMKHNLPSTVPQSDKNKIEGDFKITSVQLLPPKEEHKKQRQAFENSLAKARGMK